MGSLRKKHRWRFLKKEQRSFDSPVWQWRCRCCGVSATTTRPAPPRGTMLDDDGRNCASRIVHEVMDS